MRFRTSVLSALIVASSIGVGLSPAYAGATATGTGSISFEGTTCAFTFDYTGGPPPAAAEIQSFTIEDGCAAGGTGAGSLAFGSGDAATLTGTVSVSSPISCGYSAALTGTVAGNAVTFPEQAVPKSSGSFLCPDPANIALQLNF